MKKSKRPSKTISLMEDQLAKHRGNYRRVATDAKKAFTLLIKYNEHDCSGMKHLIDYVFSRKPTETRIEH